MKINVEIDIPKGKLCHGKDMICYQCIDVSRTTHHKYPIYICGIWHESIIKNKDKKPIKCKQCISKTKNKPNWNGIHKLIIKELKASEIKIRAALSFRLLCLFKDHCSNVKEL